MILARELFTEVLTFVSRHSELPMLFGATFGGQLNLSRLTIRALLISRRPSRSHVLCLQYAETWRKGCSSWSRVHPLRHRLHCDRGLLDLSQVRPITRSGIRDLPADECSVPLTAPFYSGSLITRSDDIQPRR